jgi:hypothetical protein
MTTNNNLHHPMDSSPCGGSSGKSSRHSVQSGTSTCRSSVDTTKCTCKCLVSLIKCNFNFANNCKKGQKSQPASSPSSSNQFPIPTTTAPNESLNNSSNVTSTNIIMSSKNCVAVESPVRIPHWTMLSATGNKTYFQENTTAQEVISSLDNKSMKNEVQEINNEKNGIKNDLQLISDLIEVEKKNEKNDLMSARSPVPLNISELNVILSCGNHEVTGGSSKKSKDKGFARSKLPFGWMKRKSSKCRSSVSSSKRLSSIKRDEHSDEIKVIVGGGGGSDKVDKEKAADYLGDDDEVGGRNETTSKRKNPDLCNKCVIL